MDRPYLIWLMGKSSVRILHFYLGSFLFFPRFFTMLVPSILLMFIFIYCITTVFYKAHGLKPLWLTSCNPSNVLLLDFVSFVSLTGLQTWVRGPLFNPNRCFRVSVKLHQSIAWMSMKQNVSSVLQSVIICYSTILWFYILFSYLEEIIMWESLWGCLSYSKQMFYNM